MCGFTAGDRAVSDARADRGPARLSDGSIYGTLTAVSHAPDPTLGERDLRFMNMLGEMIVSDLDAERSRQKATDELSELIATADVQRWSSSRWSTSAPG